MQIAMVNQVQGGDPLAFDFRVQAVNIAMVRDVASKWKGHLPGENQEPWPCVNYDKPPADPKSVHPIFEMKDIGTPDALGYHDDEADFIYGRTLLPVDLDDATTMDHEAKEMRGDPEVNLWRPFPGGLEVAQELGDPVEADRYPINVEVLGRTRRIWCSNFVLPAWFDRNSSGPWDFMGLLDGPFLMTPGGYVILRDPATGEVTYRFADERSPAGRMAAKGVGRKLADPHSRAYRRLRGPAGL